jgi:hypothetical protein
MSFGRRRPLAALGVDWRQNRFAFMSLRSLTLLCFAVLLAGCGTTRWTDTSRTATEQMLISDAIERSVSRIDFRILDAQTVYLDTAYLSGITDKDYLMSTLRQHMLASGCVIKDKKDEADFIVEARAGAVGTDRHDLLFGMPSVNLPWTPLGGTPAAIPEIALARRTDQKGVAKLAVFAYHRATGEPVWQSGVDSVASNAQNSWWLGMGPIQRGTIYDKAQFAGSDFHLPLFGRKESEDSRPVRVTRETTFNDPRRFALHNSDDLGKFGESLRPGKTLVAEGTAKSNSVNLASASNVEMPQILSSPEAWLSAPSAAPAESSGNGQVLSTLPQETPPVARLLGPRKLSTIIH